MKTASDIEDRIRYLLSSELDRRVDAANKRLPVHCVHNYRHSLDVRKFAEGEINENYNRISLPVVQQQTIGLCMLGCESPEVWGGTICEDPIDAQRCPYFTCKVTKETVWAEFNENTKDLQWLHLHMPEVYGLVWSLDSTVTLPWWKRLWFRLLRLRVEPVRQVPPNLLPEKIP